MPASRKKPVPRRKSKPGAKSAARQQLKAMREGSEAIDTLIRVEKATSEPFEAQIAQAVLAIADDLRTEIERLRYEVEEIEAYAERVQDDVAAIEFRFVDHSHGPPE